jgi:uncharacterized protein (TIGR02145 family)
MNRNILTFSLTLIGTLSIFFISCKKDDPPATDSVTDIDGNIYNTVTIGTQTWMGENLKVAHYRNGDAIPNIADSATWSGLTTGAYSDFDNLAANGAIYGKLYNWYSVDDNRNIAPKGWHVATDADWVTLSSFLGGDSIAGGKLKETGTVHWKSPNTGAGNETNFTALPGGSRGFTGIFGGLGKEGGWWSYCGREFLNGCYNRWLINDKIVVYRSFNDKRVGFSVRCVKD